MLAQALDRSVVWPLPTNAGFLIKALAHAYFIAGRIDTGLISRAGDALMPPTLPSDAALSDAAARIGGSGALAGFRLNAAPRSAGWLLVAGHAVDVRPGKGSDALAAPPLARIIVTEGGRSWEIGPFRAHVRGGASAGDGAIIAPMPGCTIAVSLGEGDQVTEGQRLATLEAMKMEHGLTAPFDGTVEHMPFAEGAQVQGGTLLVQVVASEAT